MSFGWCFLAASILTYGVANFLQSVAATRVNVHSRLDPGLLLRLVGHKTYLAGLVCQLLGFLFAFFARRDLPLFLVQTSVAAGLGVTAVLGVLVLKWKLPAAEVALLGALVAGLAMLILSAEVSQSQRLGLKGVIGLALAVPVIGVLGRLAARLHGSMGSVVLGSLAGLSFGAVAIASRPLAAAESWSAFLTDPLLYILLAHTGVAQLLLGLAMQRGSTTAAVAAMDAAAAIPPSAIGLLFLGDRIAAGREWLAGVGFVVTLGAVLLLTRYAEPQHHVRDRMSRRRAARAAHKEVRPVARSEAGAGRPA